MNDQPSRSVLGQALSRVDGDAKLRGAAKYAAEFDHAKLCYGVMVRSTVPSGTITAIDSAAAKRMPGVIFILTHENAPTLPKKGRAAVNPPAGREMTLFQDTTIRYNGEPVAVVVAETLEQATAAANAVHVRYSESPATLKFDEAKKNPHKPEKLTRGPPDKSWGEPDQAMAQAEVKVDHTYTTPMEHHNPMEPHGTIAWWDGDKVTLHDATQYVNGVKETVAKTLGIDPENVHVLSPYLGGGFGCKGSAWSHVLLATIAAREVKRPVKLILERPQMFGPVGGRPQTEQRVALGAKRDGTLVALRHDVISHTSQFEDYAEPSTQPTRALYKVPNLATTQRLAKLHVGTPTFQRAPGEASGTFAIESALDELAIALAMDPVALRVKNHADADPSSGKPWTSKKLVQCYEDAARRFGWSRRNPKPRSMREGNWLVGYGMATATYPAHRMPAKASVMLTPEGIYVVKSATHDLGTGTYTILTQVAADALGVEPQKVRLEIGDTRLPKAPVSGGSMTAASVGPAVHAACLAMKEKIAGGGKAPLTAEGEANPEQDEEKKTHAERSWGAVFAEVRVDPDLGVIRVPRIVATYSVGKLLNRKTGISNLEGGIVWGVGMALFEESVLDERFGRIVNGNLAEYHLPVNADIGSLEVDVVEENDAAFNVLGARGIGEIGITGVAAAIANAVYHASGVRVRDLPITLDKVISRFSSQQAIPS
jgi:xanthine dehydrogenase YagR molybdenum-binding subunit